MLISTLLAQPPQRLLKLVQILPILTARPPALHDLLRQRLRVLGSEELGVVRQADVHEAFDRVRDVGRLCIAGGRDALHRGAHVLLALVVVEGRVLDGVAVDLADVEVFFHFGDVGGWDAVGCAPDSRGCGGVLWGWERVSLGSSVHHCVSKSTVDWSLT
jgi:hypothetical protein